MSVTLIWHASCERHVAIGSQASNKSFGHHSRTQMIRHRSILYMAGDLRVRQALRESAAAEHCRAVSAAHRQNALLEFRTDQIDEERIHEMQNPINRSVLILNP